MLFTYTGKDLSGVQNLQKKHQALVVCIDFLKLLNAGWFYCRLRSLVMRLGWRKFRRMAKPWWCKVIAVCTFAHSTHTHAHTHTHTYKHAHTHIHASTHTYTHVHTHTHINMHTHTHTYIHTYAHTHAHTHTHTHTHTHRQCPSLTCSHSTTGHYRADDIQEKITHLQDKWQKLKVNVWTSLLRVCIKLFNHYRRMLLVAAPAWKSLY